MAVLLAAGLDGIARGLDPGPANERNMYQLDPEEVRREGTAVLPATLAEAVDALEEDDTIREALGQEYARTYIGAKRAEWDAYHNAVSQWEIDRYVDLY